MNEKIHSNKKQKRKKYRTEIKNCQHDTHSDTSFACCSMLLLLIANPTIAKDLHKKKLFNRNKLRNNSDNKKVDKEECTRVVYVTASIHSSNETKVGARMKKKIVIEFFDSM